ncbi:hypothetical protein F070042J6_30280 [Bacteroides sp. f07]
MLLVKQNITVNLVVGICQFSSTVCQFSSIVNRHFSSRYCVSLVVPILNSILNYIPKLNLNTSKDIFKQNAY